jgi:Cof subfamily protein (haloacid dehalogenase superfamily)
MKRRVIFLDIDGTLTEPGKNTPPESALRAIRGAREAGHLVFLCSGRSLGMLSALLQYSFDGVVASSGGYIRCGEELIFDCPMKPEQQEKAVRVLKKNGVFCMIECLDGSYVDEAFKDFLRKHEGEGGSSEMLRWQEQIESELNIRPMAEYRGQPVYKIVMMAEDRAQLKEPQRLLGEDFFFSIPQGGRFGFTDGELVNRKFDKGKAVRRVCEKLGIPVEDSIAFGDSVNDREMLETAGLSICMAGGSEEIKQIADEICPAVTEDGLYRAFLRHGLCKE